MPTNPFISLFGRSPIGPMQQHIAKAHECAAGLLPFFRAVIAEDWAQVEQVQQDMVRLEQEADRLKKNVRMHLPKSLFLPVPRSDLLELLSVQDKVANRAKDIVGLMLGRRMRIPLPLQGQMLAYVQRSVDASAQALRVVNELNELLETGFGGRETSLVESMVGGTRGDRERYRPHPGRGTPRAVPSGKRAAAGGRDVPLPDHRMDRRCRRPRPAGRQPPGAIAGAVSASLLPTLPAHGYRPCP